MYIPTWEISKGTNIDQVEDPALLSVVGGKTINAGGTLLTVPKS